VTPTTTTSRQDIEDTPGADQTNNLAMDPRLRARGLHGSMTCFTFAGGHQYSWLIDGVPVPNTDIASEPGRSSRDSL